ncbi:MAG TPA: hypothetical protein VII97_09150 [Anaerolineales bacterium]
MKEEELPKTDNLAVFGSESIPKKGRVGSSTNIVGLTTDITGVEGWIMVSIARLIKVE